MIWVAFYYERSVDKAYHHMHKDSLHSFEARLLHILRETFLLGNLSEVLPNNTNDKRLQF